MKEELQIGFVGNPNCGKTTLFNAYTGAKLKVANWPGVTVEKKEGMMKYQSHKLKLVDLPGIYSLTSYTMEEKLTRQFILEDEVDVIIDVADASSLERNMYLTLQLLELGKPVVLALNMMDIVKDRGMNIDLRRLSELLGIPCIPVSARKREGLEVLMDTAVRGKLKSEQFLKSDGVKNLSRNNQSNKMQSECAMIYSNKFEDKINNIIKKLKESGFKTSNYRWYAIKLLEQDAEIVSQCPIDLSGIVDRSYESDIINEKYNFIEEIIKQCLVNKSKKVASTDQVDGILTHKIFGLPVFLGIMALVFFLTFSVGDFLKGGFEVLLSFLSDKVLYGLEALHTNPVLISLVVDGIIAGVGGILTFLPNIFILFLALAFLEDSGYMSRVAYVMDGLMGKLGLSGRAFIPMLLGFGCTVPAIMASRALEDIKDRRRTILVTPFMSCSARLPIYVLFSQMFFEERAMWVAYSMYVIGLAVAILISYIMYKSSPKNKRSPLLIELPEYKAPNARTIIIYVWDKVKDYLTKAGTTIFVASIIIWFLLNFSVHGMVSDISQSLGATIGKYVAPLLVPAGLGMWQVVLALISGIAAKEVVVSSFGVIFGIANINSSAGMGELLPILANYNFGPLNAYALMVFSLLYIPCAATIGVMKRELKSVKWTLFAIVFQLVVAWLGATLVYQIGSILF